MTRTNNSDARNTLEQMRAWKAAGRLSEAAGLLEKALPAEGASRVEFLRELADIRAKQGAWNEGDRHIEEALGLASDDEQARAALLERRAWIYFRQGRFGEAEQVATEVLQQLDGQQHPGTAATLHNTLGGIAWRKGDLDRALAEIERAVPLYERANDHCGGANAKTNIGVVCLTRGEWDKAAEALTESERIRCSIGWTTGRSSNLLNLGWLEAVRGDRRDARQHLEESLRIATEAGEEYDIAHAELALAYLDFLEGSVEEASKYLDSVLRRKDCICDDDIVQAQWLKALIECHRGGSERGVALASEARKLAHNGELIESEADACRALAIAYSRCDDFQNAEQLLTESVELAERAGDPYRRGLALLEIARLYERAAGRQLSGPEVWRQRARTKSDEAAQVFRRLGARVDLDNAQQLRDRVAAA